MRKHFTTFRRVPPAPIEIPESMRMSRSMRSQRSFDNENTSQRCLEKKRSVQPLYAFVRSPIQARATAGRAGTGSSIRHRYRLEKNSRSDLLACGETGPVKQFIPLTDFTIDSRDPA